MPEEAQTTLRAYRKDVKKQIGSSIQAIILYGSLARGDFLLGRSNINLLVLLGQINIETLQGFAKLHRRWAKEQIIAPLFFTEEELRNSLNLFPLEFFEIKEQHVLLEGRDPFPELHLNEQNLFVQCEQEIRGNLFRVRQRYVEGLGQPEAVHALLPISLTALIPCLRGLYRLLNQPTLGTPDVILDRMPSVLQLDSKVFHEVWLMKRGQSTPGRLEFPRLLERYVHTLNE